MNAPHPAVFAKNLMSNPRQMMRSWYTFFFQLPRIPELLFSAHDFYLLKYFFSEWAIDKEAFSKEDLKELARAAGRPGALTGGINYYRASMRNLGFFKMARSFPRILSPTLLIWAESDRALGKELTYGLDPYFADGLRIRYIPRCSHWVQQEAPNIVNQYLDEFL
jgi:pimeloyl-ACP methyl ester carboxylesterase